VPEPPVAPLLLEPEPLVPELPPVPELVLEPVPLPLPPEGLVVVPVEPPLVPELPALVPVEPEPEPLVVPPALPEPVLPLPLDWAIEMPTAVASSTAADTAVRRVVNLRMCVSPAGVPDVGTFWFEGIR
jgi:hypothetical protein